MRSINRIKISEDATKMLATLKSRTELTPNILCRIALCYSLNKKTVTDLTLPREDGQEFNKGTLFGENEVFYLSLIKERCKIDGYDPNKDFLKVFKIHLNNGIISLYSRVKSIDELTNLIE